MTGAYLAPQHRAEVERQIKELLTGRRDLITRAGAASTRAVGDAVEKVVVQGLEAILEGLGAGALVEYTPAKTRRAMGDVVFRDREGMSYVVDVKTHREGTKFNMPNLTSVQRLAKLYESDTNVFVLLMVRYKADGTRVTAQDVTFAPIEHVRWTCLRLGALGAGQLQLANSKSLDLDPAQTRKAWMVELCDALLVFWPNEIVKINRRIAKFKRVRDEWLAR
jgi:hypothetical protein